jgi:hypothetical protein
VNLTKNEIWPAPGGETKLARCNGLSFPLNLTAL